MPRIEPVPADPNGNPVTNSLLARVMGRRPDVLRAFGQLDATIRFHGELPGELYEAVRRATASKVGCVYCASLDGACEETVLETGDRRTDLAVALARMVAEDPLIVSDQEFVELREEFSEEEIVELVAFICLVSVAGQMFGAVMGLEAADAEEAADYQLVLARQSQKRAS